MAEVGRYRLGPFLISSELALPELEPCGGIAEAKVTIRLGRVPERIENVVAHETRWWASRREYLQRVPEVASFLVRDGREIVIEPAPGSLPGDVRAYLLAPIFSSLCFQAGLYALHASAVRTPRGAVAFLGHSGAGKSTLAAFLERRGFAVLSDDLCLLDPAVRHGAAPAVIPVAPALKLWPSALRELGESVDGLPQVWSREEKYRMRIHELHETTPLAALFLLQWTDAPEDAPSLSRLQGVEAVAALMGYIHLEYIMKEAGRQAECFQLCAHILRTVPAYTLRRPRNFARMNEVTALLLDRLRGHMEENAPATPARSSLSQG